MRWKTILALALPAIAAFAVYLNTLDAGFVHDDRVQIEDNPWVKQLRHLPDLVTHPVWGFRTREPSNFYRPTQMVVYNLLWAASGGRPFAFHLTNVLLHAATSSMLALLILGLTRRWELAGGAALLFAVHPASTGTVAWVACLPEIGYSLCTLGALATHAACRHSGRRRPARLVALPALLALSAMSFKETGLVVIPLLFLLELWVFAAGTPGESARSWVRAGRATLPYAAVGLGYLVLRALVVGGVAPKNPLGLTPIDALINAPALLLRYLKLLLWPAELLAFRVFHPIVSPGQPAFWIGLPLVLALVALLLPLARRRGDLAFAGALCALPLLPVLYLPGLGEHAFAERYAYLSTAGVSWLGLAALSALAGRLTAPAQGRRLAAAAALLLAIPMAQRTVTRNPVWHDDAALARSVLADQPDSWDMAALLAASHERAGRSEEALAVYDAALARDPENEILRVNRLALLMRLGRIAPGEAIARLERLAAEYPLAFEPRAMLGDAYLQLRRFDLAEAAFRKAAELNPLDEMLYNRLAVVYVETGRLTEAREALERALDLDPQFELARQNLERLERLQGQR